MIKKLLNLFWRGGVEEIKPLMRQSMHEDEFSKKSLIGEEEEYTDMSNMVEEFGSDLEQNDLNSIFDTLKKKLIDARESL